MHTGKNLVLPVTSKNIKETELIILICLILYHLQNFGKRNHHRVPGLYDGNKNCIAGSENP